MKTYIDKLIGKKIYGCRFFGSRLDLNDTTFSICHEAIGSKILGKMEELTPDIYEKKLLELAEENMLENNACRKCSKCYEYIYEKQKISYVTVNTSNYCNSSCIYCWTHFGEKGHGYNPIPYLDMFDNAGMFKENCFFDWGGGEPTLNPYFEQTVKWICNHGYYQRINTNAIIYSKETENALIQKNAFLRISIDSGTSEVFNFMKGHKEYERVWRNIKKYCSVTDDVYIKYNICNYNSDVEEIKAFIDKCYQCNVKKVIIDAEISAYQPTLNSGPFYFTHKEWEAAHLLEKEAINRGFEVQISSFAWSVRAEYDKQKNLILPTKYYDNIDKSVVSNGIYVKTFPSIKYMSEVLKESQKKLFIWGMGHYGKKAFQVLSDKGIKISKIIDKSLDLQEEGYCGVEVISPEDFFESNISAIILLVGDYWKEMLALINKNKYDKGDIIYMRNMHYE